MARKNPICRRQCPPITGDNLKSILLIILTLTSLCAYTNEPQQDEHHPPGLIEAKDFSADAVLARQGKMPILLLVSQDYCPFCIQIKKEILGPMIASGDYQNRLLIREIFINLGSRVGDFKGNELDSSTFALAYKVYLTPTLLFLGPDGNELTERIVGIQTPEMFFFYVERAIEAAIAAFPARVDF